MDTYRISKNNSIKGVTEEKQGTRCEWRHFDTLCPARLRISRSLAIAVRVIYRQDGLSVVGLIPMMDCKAGRLFSAILQQPRQD